MPQLDKRIPGAKRPDPRAATTYRVPRRINPKMPAIHGRVCPPSPFSRSIVLDVQPLRPAMPPRWLSPEIWLPLGLLLFSMVSVPAMVLSPTGLPRLRHLQQEERKTDAQLARLTREIQELRARVERIKTEPTAVERVARDELGLVRQTEVVLQFEK